jgi:chromosome segregation ATPase
MENKDNVYEETTLTEEFAEARENGASTVLGKFKDVSALERAYESLQAEFTRRSQKLRELEKEMDNFKKSASAGAEKLRKTAQARREETKRFDAFIADMGGASQEKEKPVDLEKDAQVHTEEAEEKSVSLSEQVKPQEEDARAEKGPLAGVSKDAFLSAEELFKRANEDEEVRLRIVGEYLASLGKSGAPLTAGGVHMLATPPTKPKSVGEAGNMALLYFRKPIEG